LKFGIGACVLIAGIAVAQAAHSAEIKVVTGGSMGGVFAELVPQFERTSGHKVTVFYGTLPQIIQRAAAGEPFDVGIVPAQVYKSAAAAPKFASGPAPHIGRVGYAVAVRVGDPKPDLTTTDAFKRSMLQAKSVVFIPGSGAGAYILKVFDRLGIGDAMKTKTKTVAKAGEIAQAVASGDAELGVFVVTVFAAPGVEIAGPFPAELNDELVWDGVLAADPKEADAAKAFVEFLASPAAAAVLKAKGMTPG
jgi:molybdate transport system substrate-binding protein